MIFPTVHLNGTSLGDLIDQTEEAGIALHEAEVKLQAMMPNGRDYYPQGASVINDAIAAQVTRVEHIRRLRSEIDELLEYLYEQREQWERIRR